MQAEMFREAEGEGAFRCVAADPPWMERGGGRSKRGADRHYELMPSHLIPGAMKESPGWRRVSGSAHLWLWVTNNFLRDGLWVMEQLGFRYVTNLAWAKVRSGRLQLGLGQYLRGCHELCLFGVRGDAMLPDVARLSVVMAERTRHSRKPDAAYATIEKVSPGPRLEMFARGAREGWTTWGREAP